MPVKISSLGNPHIKQVVKLNNRRYRDGRKKTIVEGVREVYRALHAGIQPLEAYICPPLLTDPFAQETARMLLDDEANKRCQIFEVTPSVFEKIAYRGGSGGLLLVIAYPSQELEDLVLGDAPFLAIIEEVEKPGNLGGILRTANAAGVDGVVVCHRAAAEGSTDIFNPNVVRASLGALFSTPTFSVENGRLRDWLEQKNIQIIAATPASDVVYTGVDMRGGTAVVLGSEATGLSPFWVNAAHKQVTIPMTGVVDSLNLSVATALLLYEVVRQRSMTTAIP